MLNRMVFSFFMSLPLAFLMTAWVTFLNLGLAPIFLEKWLIAFFMAWPAAWGVAFLFGPSVAKLTAKITTALDCSRPEHPVA